MIVSQLLRVGTCRACRLIPAPHGAAHRASHFEVRARPRSRNKERHESSEEGIDSTNGLLLDRLETKSSSSNDVLDIDELLNDEAAMSVLRAKLMAEMAAAHKAAGGATAAAGSSSGTKQPSHRPQNRAFDSDEYDSSALESLYDTDSMDDIAQDAARKLASESQEIAEHILQEHQGDSMLEEQRPAPGARKTNSSSSSKGGSRFQVPDLKLPAFVSRGGDSRGGKQQQDASSSKGKAAASRTERQSSSSRSSSSAAGGESGGSSGSGSSKGPRRLSPDTAIGRVAEAKGGNVPLVVLKKGKARLFEAGSPMVYGGAVECVVGRPPPVAGDVVVLCDQHMVPLGWGVFNPVSMFRVRLLQSESEALSCDDSLVLDVTQLLDLRLGQAVALRSSLGLPSASTTAYRLVNSEGDRLSGLVVDVLGEVVVVQSCAAWTERYRAVITQLVQRHTGCSRVVWRPAVGILKEEGLDLTTSSSSSSGSNGSSDQSAGSGSINDTDAGVSPLSSLAGEGGADSRQTAAAAAAVDAAVSSQQQGSQDASQAADSSSSSSVDYDAVEVLEAGLSFLASPEAGQKTGFYADQRQNRAFIASLSRGKTVLDLCCYSGGFALMAAAAGASAVTGVDSSASAVQLAQDNAQLNGLDDRCAFVRDDVSTFLRAALESGESWDVVVLDPPKLAPNRGSLPRASAKYRRLNELALGVVRPGGLLMTCSCSGAMTQSGGLGKIVQEAAIAAERQVTLLGKFGAAPDHPLNPGYPEGEYLTALTYRVV